MTGRLMLSADPGSTSARALASIVTAKANVHCGRDPLVGFIHERHRISFPSVPGGRTRLACKGSAAFFIR
jgi:hypothetical protein